jgi:acyl-coenzyme A synthetase/AMP-(fatty) acid ligase
MDFYPNFGCFVILKCGSCFGSTGEASNVDEYLWLMGRACYKPIIEYCGGTEIGGGFITGSLLQAQSLAAFSTPAMGCSLFILGSDGYPIVRTKNLTFEGKKGLIYSRLDEFL